jgi:site-specific DNA recombinase
MPVPATRTAAIYTRVSSSVQEKDGASLETQELSCRTYAVDRGYVIDEIHVYRETYTGVVFDERPRLSALRTAIGRREVDRVVVHAIDRLSRDPEHMGYFLYECDRAGVEVEFVTETLDDSLEGQLIRFVRGVAAKIEHNKITERSVRGRTNRVRSGKPLPGCKPPYGFLWEDGAKTRLVPDPETAPIIRRIFREVAEGTTLRGMASKLTVEGIPTPKGKTVWERSVISQMVRNPLYIGEGVALQYSGRHARQKGRGGMITVGEGGPVALAEMAPALIDVDVFHAVQSRLAANKAQASRNNLYPEAALLRAGFVRCGLCSAGMVVHRQPQRVKYVCVRSRRVAEKCRLHTINATKLDEEVWSRVMRVLTDRSVIRTKLAELDTTNTTDADLTDVEKDLASIAAKQRNLSRAIAAADDDDATAPLVVELKALAARAKERAARRDLLLGQKTQREHARQHLGDLDRWCTTVASRLQTADYNLKRLALEYLDVVVKVVPKDHPGPRFTIEASLPIPDGSGFSELVIVEGTAQTSPRNPPLRTTGSRAAEPLLRFRTSFCDTPSS